MVNTLSHSGKNALHVFTNRNIGLGHSRLSVIDISDTGRQQMTTSDDNIPGVPYRQWLKKDLKEPWKKYRI